MSKLARSVFVGVVASLGLTLPAAANEVIYPDPTGQGISALLGINKVTRDVAFPEVAAVANGEARQGGLRSPNQFVGFVGDSEASRALVIGERIERGNKPALETLAQLRFGPNQSMVVGVHLGNRGSQGYSVEITRVEREQRAGGLGAITTVYYRINNTTSRSGSVTLNGPTVDSTVKPNAAFDRQRYAPAAFVRIPWLPITDTVRYVDEGALTRFGNLEAIALRVSSAGSRNVGLFVSNEGVVQGGNGQTARVLVDEMFRLGEAIRATQPVPFARQQGADPVQVDGLGNLRDSGQFDLSLWTPNDTKGRRRPDMETKGNWEAVQERFEPLRRALQLIQWRLEGKIDIEDIERLEGRLGVTSIQMIVGAAGLNVTVDEMGMVTAKKSNKINEEELDHLAYVLKLTNPTGRESRGDEDQGLNFIGQPLPEKAELPSANFVPGSIPGWAGEEFRLIVQDTDGTRKHFGGYLEGADARVHAIYQALEAIAARVENRPTRIAGTVEMASSDDGTAYPMIKGHVLTWVIDPLEGGPQAEAIRTKLAEWNGRWVDVMARTRITTRESGEAVLTGKINYPQRGTISGVIQSGLRIQLQEVLSRPTGVALQLTGARSGALVGDQVGRWVTVQVYMFYNDNYLPEVGYVEALQAVVSRREKIKFQLTSDQNGLLEFYDRPGGGMKVNSIHVDESTVRALWVTNREGGYSFVPEMRGWARNDSELFHLSEDPKNVDSKGVGGGVFSVLRDVLTDQIGGAGR